MGPTTSYSNWCVALGTAAAKFNRVIRFGPDTFDAWRRGQSPEGYAQTQPKPRGF
jgi:hypothetical protein